MDLICYHRLSRSCCCRCCAETTLTNSGNRLIFQYTVSIGTAQQSASLASSLLCVQAQRQLPPAITSSYPHRDPVNMTPRHCLSVLLCLYWIVPQWTAVRGTVPSPPPPPLRPHHIRIQHLWVDTHPHLFIDTHTPHFSWQLSHERHSRRLTQTAYRLTVQRRENEGTAAADQSLRWDTGRLLSNQTGGVTYAGPRLISDTVYIW